MGDGVPVLSKPTDPWIRKGWMHQK